MNAEELIALVISSFESERQNDIKKGLELMTEDFKMTDMMVANDGKTLFPSTTAAEARKMIDDVYQIKDRKYRFINTTADVEKQIVMIEFIEWYPNPETGQMYCTPQVAICEVVGGKIRRTRHYMDPRTSFLPDVNDKLEEALS